MPKTRSSSSNVTVNEFDNVSIQEKFKIIGKRRFYELLTKGIITEEDFNYVENIIDSDTTEYKDYNINTYYSKNLKELYIRKGLKYGLIDAMEQYQKYAKDEDKYNIDMQAYILGGLSLVENKEAYLPIINYYPKVAEFVRRDVSLAERIGLTPINENREKTDADRIDNMMDMINTISSRRP